MTYVDSYTILGLAGLAGLILGAMGVYLFVQVTRMWVSLGTLFIAFSVIFLFLKPIYYSYKKWDADLSFLNPIDQGFGNPGFPRLLLEPTLVAVIWLILFVANYVITAEALKNSRPRFLQLLAYKQVECFLQNSMLSSNFARRALEFLSFLLILINILISFRLYFKYGYYPMASKGWINMQEGFITLLPLSMTGGILMQLLSLAVKSEVPVYAKARMLKYVLIASLIQMLMGYREGFIALMIGVLIIIQLKRQLKVRQIAIVGMVLGVVAFGYALYRQGISHASSFLDQYSLVDRLSRDLNPYDGYVNAYWFYKRGNLYGGQTIFDLPAFLIPRVIWTEKPKILGQMRITKDLYPNLSANGIVVTSTLLGEIYANWGRVGVLLSAFLFGSILAGLDVCVQACRAARRSSAFIYLYVILAAAMTRMVRTGLFGVGHYLLLLSAIPLFWLTLSGLVYVAVRKTPMSPRKC